MKEFKTKEKKIGEGLKKTFSETRAAMTTVGKCPQCKQGTLVIKRSKFGRLIACDTYPKCKAVYKIPPTGLIQVSKNKCKECNHPTIKIIRKGKRPQEVCINPDCPSKKIKIKIKPKKCPKCGKGEMVLRKSVYGAFLACNRFPKCRTIEKIKEE